MPSDVAPSGESCNRFSAISSSSRVTGSFFLNGIGARAAGFAPAAWQKGECGSGREGCDGLSARDSQGWHVVDKSGRVNYFRQLKNNYPTTFRELLVPPQSHEMQSAASRALA